MKIVHCVFEMEIGGYQVLIVDLLNELCKVHDTSLIILNNQASESLMQRLSTKVKVYCLARRKGSRNPIPLLRFNLLLLTLHPDIVHCHDTSMIRVIKVRNSSVMLTVHDVNVSSFFFDRYDYLVAVSDAVYLDVRARCTAKLATVNNGVPDRLFKKRKQYFLRDGEQLRLVQVSRLDHLKKGQDILLHALHAIVYEFNMETISLQFVGAGDSFQYLTGLTATLQLQDHVTFTGEKSRDWLFDHLCGYHVLIQPSTYEGFGLTVVEGLSAGLPVVASAIEGPAQILGGNPAGFLFENGNSAACARKIMHILNLYTNGKLDNIMKAAAMPENHDYSIAACSSGYLKIYDDMAHAGLRKG